MVPIRINAGGGAYKDSNGIDWLADQFFIGGNLYSTTSAIANTNSDPLYQNERWLKNLSYAIPVTDGDYTVNLKFAELYFTSSGQRVFDVSAENQLFIDNLDIFAQAGSNNTALDKSFNVKVADGTLNLDFLASVNNATVTAIEVIPITPTPTASVVVQQTAGSTAVTEGGNTDSYSLVLSSAPTSNVTIALDAGNQLSFDKTTLTFTPTNWNTAQTVTVTAVNDTAVEGTQTVNITHTVSSSDPKYNNLAVGNLPVTITDNDTAPAPTGKAIRINVGGGAYTDSLGNVWQADQYFVGGNLYSTTAAIANTVDDPLYQSERWLNNLSYAIPVANGKYNVNLKFAELYFTGSGQRVFDVSAENQLFIDNLDIFAQAGSNNTALDKSFTVDVNDGTLNLNFLASANNAKIAAIEVIPVTTTPTPSVVVQQTAGSTAVTEGGNTDSYSLVLSSAPTSNVTIALAAGNQLSFDKTTLTFTPTNWNIAQTVTVTAVNDTAVEGTQTVNITHTVSSSDPKYNNLAVNPLPVTITDNDTAPTAGAIRIDTGATKTYTDTKGQVWQADNYFVGTTSVYSTTAPIGKTEDDAIYQSDRFAKNLAYQIPVANGNYTVNLHFSENYFTDFNKRVFDVSLEGQKAFTNVDIFELSKNAFFTGNNSALVLSVPTQNVSDGVLNINLDASVNNATISGIEIIPLTAPQVILQQTGGSTAVTEGGAGDSYSLVLNTKPTADVTVTLKTSVANQLTTNKTSFTFTPTNWNVAQTVTVNAVDDTAPEGAQTVNITHTVTSTDSNYNNISAPPVAVNITDNDTVAISFTQKTVATLPGHNPTTGAWGPDGRLYVASYDGEIRAYTFDQNYNVTNTQIINTIKNLYNSDILGLAFNPYDTSDSPSIYVTHTKLYGNGGGAFPDTELSVYSGEVSILQGTDFSQRTSLITGLPTSNHDHGVNGMAFDNKGDLYIGIGSNTNAGITNDNIGGLPESPFSAAILKAEISKPNFNGKIKYSLPSDFKPPSGITFDPATSQKFGDKAIVQPGVDVSVYGAGLRNPYDLVFTPGGILYATDNGPNPGFGDVSTSATTQQPTYGDKDELNIITQGQYYGHPNRNRGMTDPIQNVYYGTSQPSSGKYTAPIATSESSTDGIDVYRATTFAGQLRGHLLAQKWNQQLYDFTLSPDGTKVVKTTTYTGVADGLDVLTGPGGAIVGIDYADSRVTVATPNDAAAIGVTAYDIFPWRAPANNDAGKNTFVIGGKNFGSLANTQVIIGGKAATLTEVTSQRIKGILPSFTNTNPIDLLDVTVNSNGQSSIIADAYLPLYGSATFV
ncbi:MAG: malectin domain-containing carbohydrate-binding protein [Aulosira sp. ZfuVER01]|nr:malectin domain-containing carbohydrate-binding protein [Aulosira sp. ZfuVER01]MDZ8000523.1 malectin domain-containing carbohydrate-binding protein [Aulosira sp. DedVER01a]MDZ8056324.1 malectin domain-containing carbohydrate-binding protein [Aulosira sp. ZfuCHP01]